jgi:hypothetical protein
VRRSIARYEHYAVESPIVSGAFGDYQMRNMHGVETAAQYSYFIAFFFIHKLYLT